MPIFKIHHITKYEYNRPVKESVNTVKIFPYQTNEQELLNHELIITGQPSVQTFFDYWGNKTGVFNLMPPHTELTIESKLILRTTSPSMPAINFDAGFAELNEGVQGQLQLLELSAPDRINTQQYIDAIISQLAPETKTVAAAVQDCASYIYNQFRYIKGITSIETTVDEIMEHRVGVCQDFAHVMLQILRTMGIPSRYVSGYICPNKNGMRGEGATHAWVEAWIPGSGWAGVDPTNNVWVTNTHVKLAVGRHFRDCSPVKGTFKGPAKQKLSVFVSIGYEDGQVFEEVNDVDMQAEAADGYEEVAGEGVGAQQQ